MLWLAREVEALLADSSLSLTSLFHTECLASSAHLSPQQEQLVAVLCHLPDCLANQLGRGLPPSLLPQEYFPAIGRGVLECLRRVHDDIRGGDIEPPSSCAGMVSIVASLSHPEGRDRSLAFPAAVVSKAALLGHAGTDVLEHLGT